MSPEVALASEMFLHLQHAKVAIDFEGPHATPLITTSRVLPGLYVLLWQAFLRQTPMARCRNCANVFAVTREKRVFCSGSCERAFNQARYRLRIKKAQRLATQGRTPHQISTAMGTKIGQIRKWLSIPAKKSRSSTQL